MLSALFCIFYDLWVCLFVCLLACLFFCIYVLFWSCLGFFFLVGFLTVTPPIRIESEAYQQKVTVATENMIPWGTTQKVLGPTGTQPWGKAQQTSIWRTIKAIICLHQVQDITTKMHSFTIINHDFHNCIYHPGEKRKGKIYPLEKWEDKDTHLYPFLKSLYIHSWITTVLHDESRVTESIAISHSSSLLWLNIANIFQEYKKKADQKTFKSGQKGSAIFRMAPPITQPLTITHY